jgi:speckle-type POZ protein
LLGVGRCYYTGIFTVAGHNWCVSYYPDGRDQDSSDCISVFLHVDPAVKGQVKARVKFSLLDQAGEPLLQCYPTRAQAR